MSKQVRIETIRVKRVPDHNPDLSYLEDSPDLSCIENLQNKQRRESYSATWAMLGIYAEAEVSYAVNSLPTTAGGRRLEWFKSGGLWGIESDSDNSHFEEVEREELSDLKSHLQAFGVDVSDFEEKIEDRDVS